MVMLKKREEKGSPCPVPPFLCIGCESVLLTISRVMLLICMVIMALRSFGGIPAVLRT